MLQSALVDSKIRGSRTLTSSTRIHALTSSAAASGLPPRGEQSDIEALLREGADRCAPDPGGGTGSHRPALLLALRPVLSGGGTQHIIRDSLRAYPRLIPG